MRKPIEALTEEIKINRDYSHLQYAQYKDDNPKEKSDTIIKRKTILTSDYFKRLTNNLDVTTSIIPPNCRYIEPLKKGHIVVIEEPPAYRTIKVEVKIQTMYDKIKKMDKIEEYGYKDFFKKNKSPYPFTLAFPYVIFILYFTEYNELYSGMVFIRTQQMSGLSDILLKIPMLNINSGQHVCFGDKVRGKHHSLYAAVENAIMVWWSASFNYDYRENYLLYNKTPVINNYFEWEWWSRENPMFIYNVDWIPYTRNIANTISNMKSNVSMTGKKSIGYRDMAKMFSEPSKTGVQMTASPRGRRKYNLYYDIAQTVYLDRKVMLSVGDPLEMKNKEISYVYSFIGFVDGGDIKYVQMEKNGHLFLMKFGESFKKYIKKQLKKSRFAQKVTLPNGVIVKSKDIICIKIGKQTTYQKVDYIRKSRSVDDQEIFEMKLGSNYYLSHKLDATVLDVKKPTIYGIELDKSKSYIFIKDPNTPNSMISASKVKYNKLDISATSDKLVAHFNNIGTGLKVEKHTIPLDSDKKMPMLIDIEKTKPISGIFRVGRKVFNLSRINSNPLDYGIWAYNGCVLYENYYTLNKPRQENYNHLIRDDTFHIPGPDFDTTFTIGDKVIVADWENPINVLNVKTIQGFKINNEKGIISFILLSKDDKLTEEEYVNGVHATVRTGYIRRVTNKYKKLSVGTKIISKKSGVACFPKKDVNIIVAIIIDGPHEPLVLCSNGCTLWYSTVMKDFQKISFTSKRWKKLKHIPIDISKIKFQAGDIINGRRDYKNKHGYIIFDPSTTRYLKTLSLAYYTGYLEHNPLDKYFAKDAIFDSIPNPRIGPTKQTELGTVTGYFDFHGSVIPDFHNRSELTFINERGGMDV